MYRYKGRQPILGHFIRNKFYSLRSSRSTWPTEMSFDSVGTGRSRLAGLIRICILSLPQIQCGYTISVKYFVAKKMGQ